MPRAKKDKESPKKLTTLLSTSEIAKIFEVHPNTIRRWSEEGKLKAERVGSRGDRKFSREQVAVFYLDRAIQRYLNDKQV